jgi:hypothetical protein
MALSVSGYLVARTCSSTFVRHLHIHVCVELVTNKTHLAPSLAIRLQMAESRRFIMIHAVVNAQNKYIISGSWCTMNAAVSTETTLVKKNLIRVSTN